jgi:hypothetical protein
MNAEILSRRRPMPTWLLGWALGFVALLLLLNLLPEAQAPGSEPDAAPLAELPVSA